MAIALSCSCGKKLQVKDELAGKKIKCPGCQSVLVVPGGAAAAPPKAAPSKPAAAAPPKAAPPKAAAPKAPAPKAAPAKPASPIKPAVPPAKPVAKAPPKKAPEPAPMDDFDSGIPDWNDEPAPTPKKSRRAPVEDTFDDEDEGFSIPSSKGGGKKPAKKGGSKLPLLLGLLAVAVLGGGGAYWWFVLREQPNQVIGPVVRNDTNKGKPANPNPMPEEEDPSKPKPPDKVDPNPVDPKKPDPMEKTPPPVKEDPSDVLLKTLPGEAIAVVSLRIADWWDGKSGKMLQQLPPVQMNVGMMVDDIGLSPGDIERIQVSFFKPNLEAEQGPPQVPFFGVAVARKSIPFDKIKEKFPPTIMEADFDGIKYWVQDLPGRPAFHLLNDKVVVAADEPILKDFLGGKLVLAKTGKLVESLMSAGKKHIVVAGNIPEGLIPPAVKKNLPPPVAVAVDDLRGLLLALNDDDKLAIDLNVAFTDEGKADGIKSIIESVVPLGEKQLEQLSMAPGFDSPTKAKLLAIAKETLKSFKMDSAGETLKLQATVPASVAEMTPLIMEAVMQAIPMVQANAQRVQMINNMRQVALAMHNHNDAYRKMPSQTIGKGLSWRVALLPFLEQKELYDRFKLDEPWDSPDNIKLVEEIPTVFKPVRPGLAEPGETLIQVFTGEKTPFAKPNLSPMLPRSFQDGTSNVFLIVEAGKGVPWTKPEDIVVEADAPLPPLGKMEPNGFVAAMADASVRFVLSTVSEKTLRLAIDPSDGVPLPPDFDGQPAPPPNLDPKKADLKEPEKKAAPPPDVIEKKLDEKKPEVKGTPPIPEVKTPLVQLEKKYDDLRWAKIIVKIVDEKQVERGIKETENTATPDSFVMNLIASKLYDTPLSLKAIKAEFGPPAKTNSISVTNDKGKLTTIHEHRYPPISFWTEDDGDEITSVNAPRGLWKEPGILEAAKKTLEK